MGYNEDNVGKLQESALKRKERLAALKRKRKGDACEEDETSYDPDKLPSSQVLFRNYQPTTDNLSDVVLPPVQPTKIENLIEDQLKHSETSKPIDEVEINNLAPKKLTYDLRRGIQSQLDKLEKRTDKAIAELIRERLKEGRQQDFFMAVTVGAKVQQKQSFDSDDEA